jgi:hypothetical protein
MFGSTGRGGCTLTALRILDQLRILAARENFGGERERDDDNDAKTRRLRQRTKDLRNVRHGLQLEWHGIAFGLCHRHREHGRFERLAQTLDRLAKGEHAQLVAQPMIVGRHNGKRELAQSHFAPSRFVASESAILSL